MLQSLVIKNFIKFQDVNVFKFQNGLNIFIGQNGSGKTATLECLRKTCSRKLNESIPTICMEDVESYAIAKYKINDKMLYSCLFSLPPHKKCFKLVVDNDKVFVERMVLEEDKEGVRRFKEVCEVDRDEDVLHNFRKNYEEALQNQVVENAIENGVKDIITFLESIQNEDFPVQQETDCNNKLEEFLDDSIVFVFGPRGMSPISWSGSSLLRGNQNYKKAHERSDLFLALLSNMEGDLYELDRLIKEFTESNYEFRLESNKITVKLRHDTKVRILSLLKLPEGVWEAAMIALFIVAEKYKILCIEETGRGMHPQMIQKVRERLLLVNSEKCFIVTCHNSEFITKQLVNRVTLFRTNVQNGFFKSIQYIQERVKEQFEIFDNESVRSIVFARIVLFVEGKKDNKFISALFKVLNKKEHEKEGLSAMNTGCLHVVSLDGKENFPKAIDLCHDELQLPFMILCDRDAIVENRDPEVISFAKELCEDLDKFIDMEKDLTSEEKECLDDFVERVRASLIVWKKALKILRDNISMESDDSKLNNLIWWESKVPDAFKRLLNIRHRDFCDEKRKMEDLLKTHEMDTRIKKELQEKIEKMMKFIKQIQGICFFKIKEDALAEFRKNIQDLCVCEPETSMCSRSKLWKYIESSFNNSVVNDLESLRSAYKKKKIFSWESGNLESVVREAGMKMRKIDWVKKGDDIADLVIKTKQGQEFLEFLKMNLKEFISQEK